MMDSFGNLVRRNLFLASKGNGIAWNGSMWVAVGDASGSHSAISYSYDGKTWRDASGAGEVPTMTNGNGVAWGNDKWVAVGRGGGIPAPTRVTLSIVMMEKHGSHHQVQHLPTIYSAQSMEWHGMDGCGWRWGMGGFICL